MKRLLQHHLNALHIYCKLRKLGFKKNISLKLSHYLEITLNPILY
jgi:hypothetical protein